MACRFVDEPVYELMLTPCQSCHLQQTPLKLESKYEDVHLVKRVWKHHVQNDGYFLSASMC